MKKNSFSNESKRKTGVWIGVALMLIVSTSVIAMVTSNKDSHKVGTGQLLMTSIQKDTMPSSLFNNRSSISIYNNGKSMQADLENGKVTNLKIDGREIPENEYDQYQDEIEQLEGRTQGEFRMGNNNGFWMFDGSNGHPYDSLMFNFGDQWEDFGFSRGFGMRYPMNIDSIFNNFKFNFNEGFPFDDLQFKWDNLMEDFDIEEKDYPSIGAQKNRGQNLEEIIGKQLNVDGFLEPDQENTVELTGRYLKINGKKQPSLIWKKYKNLFETETGVPLHKNSRLEFSIIGKASHKKYKAF